MGVAAFRKRTFSRWAENDFCSIFMGDRNVQRLLTHGRSGSYGWECACGSLVFSLNLKVPL
jgi:hypothetical protein